MEIVEVEDKKTKSKTQDIFITRLKELIQNMGSHRIEKNETSDNPSLVAVTSFGVIFTILFSISAVKVGIINSIFIILFIVSVTVLVFKKFSN